MVNFSRPINILVEENKKGKKRREVRKEKKKGREKKKGDEEKAGGRGYKERKKK